MDNEHIVPKMYAMRSEELVDFVRNKAQAGDIATTYEPTTRRRYMYFCNEENIGKDINPTWLMVDERWMLKNRFRNMTLEEKVDFLIDKYIDNELYKLY